MRDEASQAAGRPARTGAGWWSPYAHPDDVHLIERTPLADRALPATTYELLARAAVTWPDRTAIEVMPEASRWRDAVGRTFGQLHADVVRAANVMHGLGVRRDDAVAVLSLNCDELITATLAAQVAGIAAPINAGLAPAHVVELLRLSGARVLVCAGPELSPAIWSLVREVAGPAGIEHVLALRPTGSGTMPAPLTVGAAASAAWLSEEMDRSSPDSFVGELPKAHDLAALFHTGGTTGTPKLAAHTHANEVTDAWCVALNSALDDDSVIFAALPLFHVNALVVTLLAPLFRGQSTLWAGPAGYRDASLFGLIWQIFEHFGVAAMSAVPTVYAVLAATPVDADISRLRFAMVGASPLPRGVRTDFETATGVPLLEGYGLTEATCASVRAFTGATPDGSVGQRMPYQQIKAITIEQDGNWADCAAGEVGIVAISGPTVFPGYVAGRDGDGLVLDGLGKVRDGWLDTGDIGAVDERGFLYLVGREKDLIIRGGHNIDPSVVEDSLLSHPAVTSASAVGHPDVHAGEVPVAYVTLAPTSRVGEDELEEWSREHVPESAAAPRFVHVVDELPVTSVGKPYKPALRADAARRAVSHALAQHDDVEQVTADVQDGAVVVVVVVGAGADRRAVEATIGRFAIRVDVVERGDAEPRI